MRRSSYLPIAVFALALAASPACALTTDRDTGMNSDGTAKFADPDEQMPGFMNGSPEDRATPAVRPSIALPMTPAIDGFHNGNPNNQGPDAFDQAYDHK